MVFSLYTELYNHHHKLEPIEGKFGEFPKANPQYPLLSEKSIDLLTYNK